MIALPVAEQPTAAIQTGVYAALTTALDGVGVYDGAPENVPFPYVVIGTTAETPDNRLTGYGWSSLVTCDVWVQADGYAPALAIAAQIVAALDHQPAALALPSPWRCITVRFDQLRTLRDPDITLRHVPVDLRVITEQEAT